MVDYDPADLRQLQQYRAVIECVPKPEGESLVDETLVRLPQPALDIVIDCLAPDGGDATALPTVEDLLASHTDLVVDPTADGGVKEAAKSPYPVLWTLEYGNADPTQHPLLLAIALQEAEPTLSDEMVMAALAGSALEQMEQEHREAATARLHRIAEQDEPAPFDQVTQTEAAYGFSAATLSDSRLVNATGVAIGYATLRGVIEEKSGDPDDIIPNSLTSAPVATEDGDPLAPSGVQTLDDYFEFGPVDDETPPDADRLVDETERVSAHDLMEMHNPAVDALRRQLKYVRDCYFLRSLYDALTEMCAPVDVPELVWRSAALDVRNDADPFAPQAGGGDDSDISTDQLFDHRGESLPPHLAADNPDSTGVAAEGGDSESNTGTQTGLGQF